MLYADDRIIVLNWGDNAFVNLPLDYTSKERVNQPADIEDFNFLYTHQREYTCNAGPFHVVFTFRGERGLLKKVFREARLRAEVQPLKPYFTNKILLSYAFYRQMTW